MALHGEGYIMRKDRDNGNGTIRRDEEGSERARVEGDLQLERKKEEEEEAVQEFKVV